MRAHRTEDSFTPVAIVVRARLVALWLALPHQGVFSTLLEHKQPTRECSKSAGIHLRTREVFRHWGVEDLVLHAGQLVRKLSQHSVNSGEPLLSFDFSELGKEADRPGLIRSLLAEPLESTHAVQAGRSCVEGG